MDPILILAISGVVAVIILVIGIAAARSDSEAEERLGRYEGEESAYQSLIEDESDSLVKDDKRGALDSLDEALRERNFGQKWRRQLARADLKLTVAEFAALHVISVAGFFVGGYVAVFQGDLVMSIVAAFIGFFVPRVYVARTVSKRLVRFEDQLPDTISLWVNALRSGYSVLQSMEAIAKDAPEPTQTEFFRVVQEVQLGIDMPDALEHLLERVESDDLDLVITAVNIQREVGGNLAEVLDTISTTIRERIKLKGEIRVLTSQGRITGYIISLLPIGLALFLNAVNPGYMGQMFENRGCGWPMIGVGMALIGIGMAIIQKIVDIEI